jgi:hypothetical protein
LRAAPKHPERVLHKQIADTLALTLTPATWFTTFPSGGGGRVRGALLKRMGLVPGVPDLLLISGGRAHWIELKAPGGSLSQAQRLVHKILEGVGCHVATCRSLNDVLRQLETWGIETRISAPSLEDRAQLARRIA